MIEVKKILNKVKECGFKGIRPLYIDRDGAWHEAYALFYLEFENGEPAISEEFAEVLEEELMGCQVNVRGTEFEVIGPDFDEIDDQYYDSYYLMDELW